MQALVLGDGDGRFTARLLARNAKVQVTAVDASGAMLRLLSRRCAGYQHRLNVVQCDVRGYCPEPGSDLVVTHFLLDCFTDDEVNSIVPRVAATAAQNAFWLVSEFHVPGGWLAWPAWLFVRGLYLAFRTLTGLRVTRLPDYAVTLRRCGFEILAEAESLGGMLTSQIWKNEAEPGSCEQGAE